MSDFWTNVSRYPRFFISSLAGLILVILAPFQNLLKIKKFRIFVPILVGFFIIFLYLIITSMAGLILIILTPFRNLLKIKKFRIILPVVLIGFFASLYIILVNMTGL